MEFKTDEIVYVRRGDYCFQAKVDRMYTSATGVRCVAFYSGPSATVAEVEKYDEYWARQRDALANVEV